MKVSKDRYIELTKMPYREYLDSPEWIAFSDDMKNTIGKCQLCGDTERSRHVHHNTYENRGNESHLDVIVLCNRCHYLYELLISHQISVAQDLYRKIVPYEAQELSTLTLHTEQTFDTFDLREHELDQERFNNLERANTFAQNYAANPKDWLAFSGTHGCGKTHLAAAIANVQSTALFITGSDLSDYLWTAFSPSNPYPYDKCFYELREASFLVLDDLSEPSGPRWIEDKFTALLKYRYEARLPTVFTIHKDVNVWPALRSLILDVDRSTPFEILAPSYRGLPIRLPKRDKLPKRNNYGRGQPNRRM